MSNNHEGVCLDEFGLRVAPGSEIFKPHVLRELEALEVGIFKPLFFVWEFEHGGSKILNFQHVTIRPFSRAVPSRTMRSAN